MVDNTLDNGLIKNLMEWVSTTGLMERYTLENMLTIRRKVLVAILFKTVGDMKVGGKVGSSMV
jgi:hypothetical protein